jgi:hypothetical protein
MLVVYKSSCIGNLNYQGSGFAYALDQQVTGIGCQCADSVLDMGDHHRFIGQDNFYAYNGSSIQGYGDRIWKWWNGLLLPTTRTYPYAFRDLRYKENLHGYQSTAGTTFDAALIHNYEYDAFTTRDWPFSAVGYVDTSAEAEPTFDELQQPMNDSDAVVGGESTLNDFALLAGKTDGSLAILDDSTQKADNAELVATLETGDTAFEAFDKYKTCNGVGIDAPTLTGSPLQVYVAARKRLSDPITWAGPYLFDSTMRYALFTVTGVWFRFKFVKTDGEFVLNGYAPRIRVRGEN